LTRLEALGPDPKTGCYRWLLRLGPGEAAVVRELPDRFERVLADPDCNRAVIERLFPSSYDDPEQEHEHRRLLGASLLEERRELLAAVRGRLAASGQGLVDMKVELNEVDLDIWLRFVNDMRLILATDLGVEENMEASIDWTDPQADKYALLEYLGGLEMLFLEGLARSFPGGSDRPLP
jgi:hypothetical protein